MACRWVKIRMRSSSYRRMVPTKRSAIAFGPGCPRRSSDDADVNGGERMLDIDPRPFWSQDPDVGVKCRVIRRCLAQGRER
jgi:hypothetical protein